MQKRTYFAAALAGMALGALVTSSDSEYQVVDSGEIETLQRNRVVPRVLDNGEVVYETKLSTYVGPPEKDPVAIIAARQYSLGEFETAFEVVSAIKDDERRAGALRHVVENIGTMPSYGRTAVDPYYPPLPTPVDDIGWQAHPQRQQSAASEQERLKGAIAKAKEHLATSFELARGVDDSLAKAELMFAVAENYRAMQEDEQSEQAIQEGLKSLRESQPTWLDSILASAWDRLTQAAVWYGAILLTALAWLARRLFGPTVDSAGAGINQYAQELPARFNAALRRQPTPPSTQLQPEEN